MNKPELTTLNGIRIGDPVQLPGISCTFTVIAIPDQSTFALRSPAGREVRAGWRTVRRIPIQRGATDER